jgi:hypothetical protein
MDLVNLQSPTCQNSGRIIPLLSIVITTGLFLYSIGKSPHLKSANVRSVPCVPFVSLSVDKPACVLAMSKVCDSIIHTQKQVMDPGILKRRGLSNCGHARIPLSSSLSNGFLCWMEVSQTRCQGGGACLTLTSLETAFGNPFEPNAPRGYSVENAAENHRCITLGTVEDRALVLRLT